MAGPSHENALPTVDTPTTVVIFGALGALSKRKLYPALAKLDGEGILRTKLRIIGISRQKMTNDVFRAQVAQAIADSGTAKPDSSGLAETATYIAGDVQTEDWTRPLEEAIARAGKQRVIYYLATAPSLFETIIRSLTRAKLSSLDGIETSLVIEKPFGHDLASAKRLDQCLANCFREDQVYRMDHYLGKDTVQNILALRFENGLFEPIWNAQYVDHVQITFAEADGIGVRGRYYEEAGALRDIVQNHMLQLLAHIAMEPPPDLSPESLRNRRAQVLRHLRPLQRSELAKRVVRGQYGAGIDLMGTATKRYLDEEFVSDGSITETFVALPVELMMERWIGVPFYLRAGKRLPKDVVEITLQFKPSAHNLYRTDQQTANLLTLRIQPNEGIALRLFIKKPGYGKELEEVDMSFCYRDSFKGHLPEAYDRLLLDCLMGDQSLFTRADEVESSWAFVEPILTYWSGQRPPEFPNYQGGSWGPRVGDELMDADGRRWWSDRLDVCPIPGAGQAVAVADAEPERA